MTAEEGKAASPLSSRSLLSPATTELETAAWLADAAAWVQAHAFRRLALQFPDELLARALAFSASLQAACPAARVFVLADTAFGRRAPLELLSPPG
jgi:hypothetical protein